MDHAIREKWNRRYADDPDKLRHPDPLLVDAFRRLIEPEFPSCGDALDLAGGRGRHSIWLAQQGWRVTMADISDVGVAEARRHAEALGLRINFVVSDSTEYAFAPAAYDLIVVFLYLERSVFPLIEAALRPGGILVYKTYTVDHERYGRSGEKSFFLQRDELRIAFPALQVLKYDESEGAARLVARKAKI